MLSLLSVLNYSIKPFNGKKVYDEVVASISKVT